MDAGYAWWLAAGFAAGLADYGLGLGFGLAASIILAGLLGLDPRTVAAAAAAAQLATTPAALASHQRAGIIGRKDIAKAWSTLALLATVSTLSSLATAHLASSMQLHQARRAYACSLLALAVLLLSRPQGARMRGSKPILAALLAAAAGAEKALVGGGYTTLIVAAAAQAGIDPAKAIALAPLVKLPPYIATLAVYAAASNLDPVSAALLAAGAAAAAPLAPRLLTRVTSVKAERLTVTAAIIAAASTLLRNTNANRLN